MTPACSTPRAPALPGRAALRPPRLRTWTGRAVARLAVLAALALVMTAAGLTLGGSARAQPLPGGPWLERHEPGLRFEYTPEDRALADQLWPVMRADRETVMERLRMFPAAPLRVILAPTVARFDALLGGTQTEGTLGAYLVGRGIIVLRSPRTVHGGGWDLRDVLRHELAHGIIDLAIHEPIPLWLNEGLAILVSGELDYLDEAQLTTRAVVGGLIPMPELIARFPRSEGARTLAYAQAASFVRFLLRQDGMEGLQRLLHTMAMGASPPEAFLQTYGEPLSELEQRWQHGLSQRFSMFTLITTTSLLGGLGIPLLLLAVLRRWWQRRRAYRQWEQEERLQAAVRGEPPRLTLHRGGGEAGPACGPPSAGPPLRDGWN